MVALTILTLHVPPDRRDEVLRYYETSRVLQESGAASAKLCVAPDDPGAVVVVAEWADAAAYEAWQQAQRRAEISLGILEIAGDSVTATSEVFHVVVET